MAPSALRDRRRETGDRRRREPHVIGRLRIERGKPPAGLGDDVVDQEADELAHQFVHQVVVVEPRIGGADRAR